MRVDLHVHTSASDGSLSPAETIVAATEAGVAVIAITDHDTVDGIDEAQRSAATVQHTIRPFVVPGIELSSAHREKELHILGYFVDHNCVSLRSYLIRAQQDRLNRARRIVAALDAAGYEIDLSDVLSIASGNVVGRSHVARALADNGAVSDISDAFSRLLGHSAPFYVAKLAIPTVDAVSIIRDSGGVPVVAHLGMNQDEGLLEELAMLGIKGVEAYHPEHDAETTRRLVASAQRLGLIITGGSDYHGPGSLHQTLGAVRVPESCVTSLFLAAGRQIPEHLIGLLA